MHLPPFLIEVLLVVFFLVVVDFSTEAFSVVETIDSTSLIVSVSLFFKDSRYAIVSLIYFVVHSLEQAKFLHLNTSACDWQYAHGSKSFPHTRQAS